MRVRQKDSKIKPSNYKSYKSKINSKYVFPQLAILETDFYVFDNPQTNFKKHNLALAQAVGLRLVPQKGKIVGWLRAGTYIVMLDRYSLFWRRFCIPNSDKRYWLNQVHGGKL